MFLQPRALVGLMIVAAVLGGQPGAYAELLASADTANAINHLYENLLQREYAGPVVFPNHQMERKAQRSPSRRLRFGRRSDPDEVALLAPPLSADKRWWGDVHQKPIRSPSLRLRFGKRQDDETAAAGLRNTGGNTFDVLLSDTDNAAWTDETGYDDGYERVERKPQRLRWGRSVPYEQQVNAVAAAGNFAEMENELNSEKWRNMLLALGDEGAASEEAADEFQRIVRKPGGPVRFRWGRSTGGRSSSDSNSPLNGRDDSTSKLVQQKKSLGASIVADEPKQQNNNNAAAQPQPNAN